VRASGGHPSLRSGQFGEGNCSSRARAKPGQLTFARPASGARNTWAAAAEIKSLGHVNMVAVPYKGAAAGHDRSDRLKIASLSSLFRPALGRTSIPSGYGRSPCPTSRARAATPSFPPFCRIRPAGMTSASGSACSHPRALSRGDRAASKTRQRLKSWLRRHNERLAAQGAIPAGASRRILAALIRRELVRWAKSSSPPGNQGGGTEATLICAADYFRFLGSSPPSQLRVHGRDAGLSFDQVRRAMTLAPISPGAWLRPG